MLSDKLKKIIRDTITFKPEAEELITAIESELAPQADNVPVLGATSNLPTSNVTLSTSNTYSDAAVKTAIDTAVNALKTAVESRLDASEGKTDEVIGALVAANLMASS